MDSPTCSSPSPACVPPDRVLARAPSGAGRALRRALLRRHRSVHARVGARDLPVDQARVGAAVGDRCRLRGGRTACLLRGGWSYMCRLRLRGSCPRALPTQRSHRAAAGHPAGFHSARSSRRRRQHRSRGAPGQGKCRPLRRASHDPARVGPIMSTSSRTNTGSRSSRRAGSPSTATCRPVCAQSGVMRALRGFSTDR
jgi:hypothetical protein